MLERFRQIIERHKSSEPVNPQLTPEITFVIFGSPISLQMHRTTEDRDRDASVQSQELTQENEIKVET